MVFSHMGWEFKGALMIYFWSLVGRSFLLRYRESISRLKLFGLVMVSSLANGGLICGGIRISVGISGF
jgi:hypothetical protein